MPKDRILVFGGTGLVGREFHNILARRYNIINFSRQNGVDIRDLGSVQKAVKEQPFAIGAINLVAMTDTNRAWGDPEYQVECSRTNVTGAANFSIACQERGVYAVHVSTDYCYDGNKQIPYLENDDISGIEPYGQTKAQGELQALKYGASVATLSFPYTRNPSRPDAVSKIVAQLRSSKAVLAFDDQWITPTEIGSMVLAVEQMIIRKLPEKYHVVGSTYETPHSMRVKIAEKLGLTDCNIIPTSVFDYNLMAQEKKLRPFQPRLKLDNTRIIADACVAMPGFSDGISFLDTSS